jgi:hypothetical protein
MYVTISDVLILPSLVTKIYEVEDENYGALTICNSLHFPVVLFLKSEYSTQHCIQKLPQVLDVYHKPISK